MPNPRTGYLHQSQDLEYHQILYLTCIKRENSIRWQKNSLKNKNNFGGNSDVKIFAKGSGGGGSTTGFASVSYKNVDVSATRHEKGSAYSLGVKIPIKSKKI